MPSLCPTFFLSTDVHQSPWCVEITEVVSLLRKSVYLLHSLCLSRLKSGWSGGGGWSLKYFWIRTKEFCPLVTGINNNGLQSNSRGKRSAGIVCSSWEVMLQGWLICTVTKDQATHHVKHVLAFFLCMQAGRQTSASRVASLRDQVKWLF